MIAEKNGKEDFLCRRVERAMQQVLQTEMTCFLAATVASVAGLHPGCAVQSGSMEESGGCVFANSYTRAEAASAPKVRSQDDEGFGIEGGPGKDLGWNTLRHSYCSMLRDLRVDVIMQN